MKITQVNNELLNRIILHSKEYGSDVKINSVGLEEECERELEIERELLREVNKPFPRQ